MDALAVLHPFKLYISYIETMNAQAAGSGHIIPAVQDLARRQSIPSAKVSIAIMHWTAALS